MPKKTRSQADLADIIASLAQIKQLAASLDHAMTGRLFPQDLAALVNARARLMARAVALLKELRRHTGKASSR